MQPLVTLAHVTLDRPRREDAEIIARALRDWSVVRWLSAVPWPYGSEDALDFIARAGPEEHAVRVQGQLAGMVRGGRDLGIWIMPAFQRQGIGLRACVLALSRSFRAGIDQVAASHIAGNHRSAALLARLGFRDIGPRPIASRAEGRTLPGRALALSRADFTARHGLALTTPRLRIDGVRRCDLAELRRIAVLPEVARMLFLFHADMPEAEFVSHFPDESLVPPFRLVARHGSRVAGSIGISAGTPPSIFYFLDPAHAGRGLGGEMVAAFVREITLRHAHPVLRAEVFTDNPASRRILERIGFQAVGETPMPSLGRGAPAPAWVLERHADAA